MITFSKKEALQYGWNTTMSHFKFLVGVTFVVLGTSWIFGFLADSFEDTAPILEALVVFVANIISMIFNLSLLTIALRFVDGRERAFSDLIPDYRLFFKYLGATIVYLLIIIGGLILFVVPGIVWSVKFGLFPYVIVDEGAQPIRALKQSAVLTKGTKWQLFLFYILLGLVNMLGMMAFGVGLLVTVPTTFLAFAFVYRKLHNKLEPVAATETHPTVSSFS
jgi:uncharacterized membrane protein